MKLTRLFPELICILDDVPVCDDFHERLTQYEYRPTGYYLEGKTLITTNTRLLDDFKETKNHLIDEFNRTAHQYLGLKATFRLGPSWGTKTEPFGHGAVHSHSNYYYSGVFYPKDCSSLTLFAPDSTYCFAINKQTEFNANQYTFAPEAGQAVLFPSKMRHKIDYNNSEEDRYSIAFNFAPMPPYGVADSEVFK